MIGIYQDSFLEYLTDENLEPKTSSKNIIIKCPWCEYHEKRDHYHLYISLEYPIFHCFHAACETSGTIKKLVKKIEGHDISDKFVDRNTVEQLSKQRNVFIEEEKREIYLPEIKSDKFLNKHLYLRKRLKFANISFSSIKGLIFDVEEFLNINKIAMTTSITNLKDYLQSNFIGFLTEHNSKVIFRNVDDTQAMRYFKLELSQPSIFLDYYKLPGGNPNSNTIVLAEGIFDIFSAYLFDVLDIKRDIRLYACSLSSKFGPLIQSIVFNEQIFKPDIVILSDNGIPLGNYEKLKKYNNHIINTLKTYYNKAGKDFGESPVIPDKQIISLQKKKYLFGTKYKNQDKKRGKYYV